MPPTDKEGLKRISVDLPIELINHFDQLKEEWGLRRRGAVLERLLEEIFDEKENSDSLTENKNLFDGSNKSQEISDKLATDNYIEDTSIVLISSGISKNNLEPTYSSDEIINLNSNKEKELITKSKGINLPGFVSRKTEGLKTSLGRTNNIDTSYDSIFNCISDSEVKSCMSKSLNHWLSLYGQKPNEEVLEASMIWLAREIWPNIDDTQNLPFTWHAASKLMSKFCSSWKTTKPSFERIVVMAGVFEDPFATISLINRIPTLIRRFVNSFKRRSNVTSFQTLQSTMTVHGALKLLDMPTTAGKMISLSSVKDSYKAKALANHPDSGGSSESMRQINEAYQLLKDLYKNK